MTHDEAIAFLKAMAKTRFGKKTLIRTLFHGRLNLATTCDLTGADMVFDDPKSPYHPALLLIDESLGCVQGNVRVVCQWLTRLEMSEDEIKDFLRPLVIDPRHLTISIKSSVNPVFTPMVRDVVDWLRSKYWTYPFAIEVGAGLLLVSHSGQQSDPIGLDVLDRVLAEGRP